MLEFLFGIGDKAAKIKGLANQAVTQISKAAHLAFQQIPYVLSLPSVNQFQQGLSVPANAKAGSAILNSPNKRKIAEQCFYFNMAFLGAAVTYEGMKASWRYLTPSMQDSYFEWGVDSAANGIFALLPMVNILFAMCMVKTAATEHPIKEENKKNCQHNFIAVVRGILASPFYYISNLWLAEFIKKMLPLGEYLSLPVLALAYGQCFTEYLLGELCTEDRYKVFSENNPFLLGLGSAFLLSKYFSKAMITSFIQLFFNINIATDNSYLEKAVFNLLFPYFILTIYLMDKPLPGKEMGIDYLCYGRLVMEKMLQHGSKRIAGLFQNSTSGINWEPLLNHLPECRPVLMYLAKTRYLQLYFEICGDDIQNGVKVLIKIKNKKITKRLAYVISYLPYFLVSAPIQKAIDFLLQKKLDDMLKALNIFISDARLKIKIYDKKALQKITLSESATLPAPSVPTVAPVPVAQAPSLQNKNKIVMFMPKPAEQEVTKKEPELVDQDWEIVARPTSKTFHHAGFFGFKSWQKRNSNHRRAYRPT